MAIANDTHVSVEIKTLATQSWRSSWKRPESYIRLAGFEPRAELPRVKRNGLEAQVAIDRANFVLGEGRRDEFTNISRWFAAIDARPAVARARAIGTKLEFKREMMKKPAAPCSRRIMWLELGRTRNKGRGMSKTLIEQLDEFVAAWKQRVPADRRAAIVPPDQNGAILDVSAPLRNGPVVATFHNPVTCASSPSFAVRREGPGAAGAFSRLSGRRSL